MATSKSRATPALYSILITFALLLAASLWTNASFWNTVYAHVSGNATKKSVVPKAALALNGTWQPGLSLVERRKQMADQLRLIQRGRPALVVLEDWLDEPDDGGVAESVVIHRAGDSPLLVALGATHRKGQFKSLSQTAQALKAAHAFKVSRKSAGKQSLRREWQLARQPLAPFLGAASAAGMVETEPGSDPEQVPMIFEIRGRWMPGLGLEALLRYWSIPRKGLRFIFNRDGRLTSLELKGVRHPLQPTGDGVLPARKALLDLPEYPLTQVITDPKLFRDLRAKVVFFRPWPAQLGDRDVFDRQRLLFAGMLNESLNRFARRGVPSWPWGLAIALAMLLGALGSGRLLWGGAALVCLALVVGAALEALSPVAAGAAMVSLGLWGIGVSGFKALRLGGQGESLFYSVVAPSRAAAWRRRFVTPEEGGSLKGLYVVAKDARKPGPRFEAWMAQWDAFLDPSERDRIGLFLPLQAQDRVPIEAVWQLYQDAGKPSMALCLGDMLFTPSQWMNQHRWALSGRTKERALKLSETVGKERLLMTELEYQAVRSRVKIQMVGSQALPGDAEETKIFNILEVVS